MSRLKARLANLRQQAGTAPQSGPPLITARTLAERVQRSRVHPSAPAKRPHLADADVAAALGGLCIVPGLIVADNQVSLAEAHGSQPLNDILHLSNAGLGDAGHVPAEGMVFMDTETTGLAGGTGTLVFLLGLGRLTGDTLQVRQYFLTGFGGEAAMLSHAADWLAGAETVVTYNGKTFDAPLLATRYRLAGIKDPFAALTHLDLLYPTRRAFAKYWPDCCLKTSERSLLGFQRVDDMPGHEAPQTWFDFVRLGNTQRLPALLEHNYWDIVSLAALVPALASVYGQPDAHEADILAIARHRLRQGDEQAAYGLLHENRTMLQQDALLELARLHRRRGEWEEAAGIWRELATQGCLESVERLAKFHEHVKRDFATALEFTERLISLLDTAEHHRRLRRLKARLGANPDSAGATKSIIR